MDYNSESHITTIAEVKAFFIEMVKIAGDEWHPDDSYSSYKDRKTKECLFTPEEIVECERLQSECFAVCDAKGVDIYDLGWEAIEASIE
ncbi:MAG: hypothetical protein Q4D33_02170 [Prevotellaceae bacterium]|nr:hypothetical protein [Prevotellaceae bacterium]